MLLDLLFPRRSLGGRPGTLLTADERDAFSLRPVRWEGLALRQAGIGSLDMLVAAGRYASPQLRRAVRLYKYSRIRALAGPLGRLLLPAARLLPDADITLCPVPLHWIRLFDRGFNQAELLAQAVAWECGWPIVRLLARARPTGHQAKRSGAERRAAMDGAFTVRVPSVPPHVVLLDDIATTGTTLDRCACLLKSAGARRVDALVLALGGRG